jgi:hypothetical protein
LDSMAVEEVCHVNGLSACLPVSWDFGVTRAQPKQERRLPEQ